MTLNRKVWMTRASLQYMRSLDQIALITRPVLFSSVLDWMLTVYSISVQLIAAVVNHIISTATKRAALLIFLPGVQEIRQCIGAVCGAVSTNDADIFPLHANLSNDEQRRVFAKTSKWKIIAATNVAEVDIMLILII